MADGQGEIFNNLELMHDGYLTETVREWMPRRQARDTCEGVDASVVHLGAREEISQLEKDGTRAARDLGSRAMMHGSTQVGPRR